MLISQRIFYSGDTWRRLINFFKFCVASIFTLMQVFRAIVKKNWTKFFFAPPYCVAQALSRGDGPRNSLHASA